ncbi:MAG: MOSC domain-containing protein [Plesiomonas sp.]|uniref:MOSC domain-containing protein n=1 Tax=Plesiomonas sp. TaxID=2486279 RepID=UPI003F34B049
MNSSDMRIFHGVCSTQLHGIHSAIYKNESTSALFLSELGFEGDQQADTRHHGGVDRALHYYPAEHYEHWADVYAGNPNFIRGALGENLSGFGLTEENCHVGDVFQLGEAVVQISQPRSPCYKLNLRFEVENLAMAMQSSGRTGWLLRVLQPGIVQPKDTLKLLTQGSSPLSVYHMNHIFYTEPLNHVGLVAMNDCEQLAVSWKGKVQARLQTGMVEDWNARLYGKALWAK